MTTHTNQLFIETHCYNATLLKLWIIHHEREVSPSGTLHIRLMKRQESYNGSIIWRLEGCIASLPITNLIALILFGLLIL